MLDLLKKTPNKRPRSSMGFTLLEVLTVLFIIGAAAALVTPNLPLMLDRLSFAAERDTLIRDINALPYVALQANQDIVLSDDVSDRDLSSGEASLISPFLNSAIAGSGTRAPYSGPSLRAASLNVPEGWRLQIPTPILYKPSGFCSGGEVSIIAGRLQYDFELSAPYCQITEQDL